LVRIRTARRECKDRRKARRCIVIAMQIPFTAYADDCTVRGEIALGVDRLSDLLSSTTEYEVQGVAFKALDDGRVVEAGSAAVLRDDLCMVVASGPRGRVDRRLWTRQHPVRAKVGPYTVLGYLHAPPTVDPMRSTDRRAIVALTNAVVGYAEGDKDVWAESDTILVNTHKIDRLETAHHEDLGLGAHIPAELKKDPRAKDLT
jgi:hypothetical protein